MVALIGVMIGALLLHPPLLQPQMLPQALAMSTYFALISLTTRRQDSLIRWIGFAFFALLLSWQLLGLGLTLGWLLATTALLVGFTETRSDSEMVVQRERYLQRLLLGGYTIVLLALVAPALQTAFALPTNYSLELMLLLVPALLAVWLGAAFLSHPRRASSAENTHPDARLTTAPQDRSLFLAQQVTLLLFAVIAPWANEQIGDLLLYLGLALLGVQALQTWRSDEAREALSQQLAEATALDRLREAVTTQVTRENVLRVLRDTLIQCLSVEKVLVLLYDSDDEIIEIPLIVEPGQPDTLPARRFGSPELRELFPDGLALCLKAEDTELRDRLGVPTHIMSATPALVIPLVAGDGLIGTMLLGGAEVTSPTANRLHMLERFGQQVALALRNASLYDRTTHIAQNLSIVNQSMQDVMFNLNREEALKRACQVAAQVTGADKSAIYLVQAGEDNLLRLGQSLGLEAYSAEEGVQRISPHPSGVVAVEPGEALNDDSSPLHHLTRALGASTSLQIPLRSSNITIGKLIVFNDRPRLYSMLERSVLETLANQASAAIDNSDLLQALERFATEQADLVNLSRISSEDLDLERIVRAICDVLEEMFLVNRVEIGIVEGENLRIYAPLASEPRLLYSEDIPAGTIPEFAPSQSVQVYDRQSSTVSSAARQYWQERGARTIVTSGMQIDQQSLGLVMLMDQRQRTLSEDELHLLEMVTNQITGQIHNAHVYALTEAALVQRLQQLTLLEELTQQIAQSTDLDLIIDTTLEAALQATEAEFAALALQEEQSGTYKLIWQERLENTVRRGASLASPEPGVVQQVAQTGEIKLFFDNRKAPGYQAPYSAEGEYLSTLAVPLHDDNRVMGVLRVESTRLDHFTEAQVSFIRNLAEHAAISIEKAQMLAERQRRIQMLTMLRNLSMETLSANNPQHVAHIILRTAVQLLDGAAALLYIAEGEQAPQLFSSLALNGLDLDAVSHSVPEVVLRRAAQESTTQMISDVWRSSLVHDNRADLPYRSLIVVPVLRRGIVHELLCVVFEETRFFGLQDLNAVDLLAAQVSGHLENARLNEALHISHDRMRAIINSTQSSIILLDMDGVIQDVNTVAEDVLGTRGRDIRQQSLASVIRQRHHDDDSWQALLASYEADPEQVQGEEYVFLYRNTPTDFKAHLFPVLGKDETLIGHLLVLRDITEEKELQRHQYRIQRMIVHDLVGPLGAIITGLSFTKEVLEAPQEGEDVAGAILSTTDVSLDSAQNLLHMVETLRDLPKTTNMTIRPSAIGAQELVTRARDALSAYLVSDSIAFEYHADGDVPSLYVDADLTRRVLINLLHNAFKFTPEGGTILIAVDDAEEQAGYLRLRICDTGPGIPPEERQRVFQEYTQIDGRLPRAGGRGMGLGLHFCKLAVEAHGGTIGVDDEGLLSGACISFTLPAISTEENALPAPEES